MVGEVGDERRETARSPWDPDLDANEGDLDFRLTYAGPLRASQDDNKLRQRSHHVHDIRQQFHAQLKILWAAHPVMKQVAKNGSSVELYVGSGAPPLNQIFDREGFKWLPIVTKENGLICKVEILMLREGQPGKVLYDIDNRLKTLFDALRMPTGPEELGEKTVRGKRTPQGGENPFYVLLETDSLITHIGVTADTLLEPVPGYLPGEPVRLVINVTIRPYRAFAETAGYA